MLYAIVVVLVLIADQGVKYWTTVNIELNTGVLDFIPKFIQLRNIHNEGAAFGLFQNMRWVLVALTIVFVIVVIVALNRRLISGSFGRWMAVLVLGGAIGNCIDRVIHGYVVDTFEFVFKIFGKSFPVFNIADIFVTLGGILFCIYVIFHKEEEPAPVAVKGRGGSVVTKPARRRVSEESAPLELTENGERRARIRVSERPSAEAEAPQPSQPRSSEQTAQTSASGAPPRQRSKPQPQTRTAAAPPPRQTQKPAEARPAAKQSAPAPAQRRPAERPAPKPEPKPTVSSESFDLEDILNEFKDL